MSSVPLRPGVALGAYPERDAPRFDALESALGRLVGPVGRRVRTRRSRIQRFVGQVGTREQALLDLNLGALLGIARDLRGALGVGGLSDELLAKSFALVRVAAQRTLGVRHYDVQVEGGWIILNGMLAEMETGEGKTLTATLPASTAALAGIPVHVITVNDYLAQRDAGLMAPLYRSLGLTVGVAREGAPPAERRAAYACDITYCTAKQVAFDYLHDRVVRGPSGGRLQIELSRLSGEGSLTAKLLLRGLCFAVVDEADSVLIDEARTPLILSRGTDTAEERRIYGEALHLARQLRPRADFALDVRERRVELTDAGRARLAELGQPLGGLWSGARRREALIHQALSACHLFERDRDYLVRDGKVEIIDENTGRVMADRAWEHGLHQLVELKEGCELSGRRETIARTTFQRFFRRYLRLGGMSGTLDEVAGELRSVYRLDVAPVAPHRPSRRVAGNSRLYASAEAKRKAIAATVAGQQAQGRPVLIGTRSVADSEWLSARLQSGGIVHQVLNARQDKEEAQVVARAGEAARITVATNMAGRGTDIALAPGVAETGGLHVIVADCNIARRIDRQLIGRCARQGDPGSHEAMLSLNDELIRQTCPLALHRLARWLAGGSEVVPGRLASIIVAWAQRSAEREHARARRALLRLDEHLADALAFTGRPD